MRRVLFPLIFVLLSLPVYAVGAMLDHTPIVPPNSDFVRSVDVDLWVERTNEHGLGAQTGRLRLRFLDPDVNAFVGMVAGFHHFNEDLRIGKAPVIDTAGVMANWGGVIGIVRGKHLWELDMMGTNLSLRLGAAVAIVGEHHLSDRLLFYHRTELNVYTTDAIVDADQGFYWMWKKTWGLSLGYRLFKASDMDRSGPHLGVRLYFESPKIPFIFPSLG